MTGIPENIIQGMQPQQQFQQPQQQSQFQMPGGNTDNNIVNNPVDQVETPLTFLKKDKSFQMMKLMVQTDQS